jgi:hypothetical protein
MFRPKLRICDPQGCQVCTGRSRRRVVDHSLDA